MTYDILNSIGVFGAVLYLVSYFLLQTGFIGGNSNTYTLMNLAAASCVAISLTVAFNAASMIVQVSWIVISIYGLARMYVLTRGIRFSPDEKAFVDDKLPGLPRHLARRILSDGVWIDGEAGAELTVQGTPNKNLVYLHSGTADVILNGQRVATCQPGSFIGELTVLKDEPATATVTLNSDARYLCLDAEALRKLCAREASVAQVLENSFSRDIKAKLEAANAHSLQAT